MALQLSHWPLEFSESAGFVAILNGLKDTLSADQSFANPSTKARATSKSSGVVILMF
jgi:hypothetical protein